MGIYAYGTVLRMDNGPRTVTSSTIGYSEAANEDEARGIAVRRAEELKPGFNIVQVNVIEIVVEVTHD